jgi:methanogenic corrinoid protein MtbC1
MFRWCSYCQKLLGETPPYDDYRVSHGICSECAGKLDGGAEFPVRGLALFQKLFAAAQEGDLSVCRRVIAEALSLGWSASDAAVGLIQPALYEIGRLWEAGKVSIAQERVFSAWCDRAMTLLEKHSPKISGKPQVLICAVDGNRHLLGPRMAALYLRDRGVRATALLSGLPDDEIVKLCRLKRPEVLGLSVAMEAGLPRVRAIKDRLGDLQRPPRVVVGGLAARLEAAAEFERVQTVADILPLLS